jgi:hypothetical protein
MRRIRIAALMGIAVVVAAMGVAAVVAEAKTATFKAGTYKVKSATGRVTFTPSQFNITLKRAKCGGATGLCVVLPKTPEVQCIGPAPTSDSLGSFATPVALPSSGKVTQHMAVTGPPPVPGEPASMGQALFSVTFTKKGTATGYFEQSLTFNLQGQSIPCTSGKVPFTAKLG